MPFQICRVCYQRGYDFLSLIDEAHNYEYKLSSCIPEIDIYVIHNPGICHTCADMLDVAFKLRNICIENEKRYNTMFLERNEKSTMQISIVNENVARENCYNDVQEIHSNYDSPDLLSVAFDSTTFCSTCNKHFSTEHDKKLHDSKLHRQLQHRNLSPINRKSNSALLTKQSKNGQGKRVSETPSISDVDKSLICNVCSITFANKEELESHKSVHLKKSCHICKKVFYNEGELSNHIKLHFIKCCGKSFSTTRLLELHMHKEHNMTCDICNERFTQVQALFNHVLDHVEIHWYTCNFCGKEFKTNEGLNKHICKYYECNVCNTICLTKQIYNEHLRLHEAYVKVEGSVVIQTFDCKSCSSCYESELLLLEHVLREHNSHRDFQVNQVLQKNTFSCLLCEKEYQLHIHLKMHILQVHCNKVLTIPVFDFRASGFYEAQMCLRRIFNILSKYLTRTSDSSSLRRRPKLRRCFKTLSQYLTHATSVHVSSEQLIRLCVKICFACNVLYTSSRSFGAHVKVKHSSCCNIQFKSVDDYFQHNFTHYNEGERAHGDDEILCLRCTRKYKNYTSLLVHSCSSFKYSNICINDKKRCENKVKFKHRKYVSPKKRRTAKEAIEAETAHVINTRCTIELLEIDPIDQPEELSYDNDSNSDRSVCEMCKEQFECQSALLDHIKIHI